MREPTKPNADTPPEFEDASPRQTRLQRARDLLDELAVTRSREGKCPTPEDFQEVLRRVREEIPPAGTSALEGPARES